MTVNSISLADARRVIAAGEAAAANLGQPSNIAVVDAGGNLVAHIRMDGAWLGSIDISINKAFTARAFDISTKDLAGLAGPIFAGGEPLKVDGRVVGGVGVSGGTGQQDQFVVEAAVTAF